MVPHSSTLAWKILWMEEPGRLQSMGSLRVGHGNGNPLQCSSLDNPRDCGAWWAAVYGVAQSWTRLKRLSSSSSKRQIRFLRKSTQLNTYSAIFLRIQRNIIETRCEEIKVEHKIQSTENCNFVKKSSDKILNGKDALLM